MEDKIKKVAIFAPVPAPYRAYEYDLVQERLADKYKFKCFFLESKADMSWNDCLPKVMESETLPKSRLWKFWRKFHPTIRVNSGVLKKLRQFKPDFVITHGYDSPSMVTAVMWAKLSGRKVLFRSDANSYKILIKPVKWRKKLFISSYFKMVDRFLTIGSRNEEHYRFYGADKKKFFRGSYVVNSDFYRTKSELARSNRQAILKRYGISQERLILFVGRLFSFKGLEELIDAFIKIQKTGNYEDCGLIIAGDGPEKGNIESRAKPVADRVYFTGFLQPDQVAELMGISDLFVLPSRLEAWGLVMNEAMESSLPIIASNAAGASPDLIEAGKNGYMFTVGNVDELADDIAKVLQADKDSDTMRKESHELINEWNKKYDVVEAYAKALASLE